MIFVFFFVTNLSALLKGFLRLDDVSMLCASRPRSHAFFCLQRDG